VPTIHYECAVVPAYIPGVIGVPARGKVGVKSICANYGVDVTQVIAQDVIRFFIRRPQRQTRDAFHLACVALFCPADLKGVDPYGGTSCDLQSTAMASPHVAGVAALIMSIGVTSPNGVASIIAGTAGRIPKNSKPA
jgi:hypothetical protein